MTPRRFVFVLALGVVIVLFSGLERKLVFYPSPAGPEYGAISRGVVDAAFAAEDGTKLHGWYFPATDPKARIAVFSHGNAGNVALWADAALELNQKLGLSVLLYDYRGYGKSEGSPSTKTLILDGRAASDWLQKHSGRPAKEQIQIGRSLGGAVAVKLAAEGRAAALVLQSTFNALAEVGKIHFPWLPAQWLLGDPMDSAALVAKYVGPTFQSHGTSDELIPMGLARKLFDAANEPKKFFEEPGGTHNSPPSTSYFRALSEFLR